MEYSMYSCPKCKKVYKVKGNNKTVFCKNCEDEKLDDLFVSNEEWNLLTQEEKRRLLNNEFVDKKEEIVQLAKAEEIKKDDIVQKQSLFENMLSDEECHDIPVSITNETLKKNDKKNKRMMVAIISMGILIVGLLICMVILVISFKNHKNSNVDNIIIESETEVLNSQTKTEEMNVGEEVIEDEDTSPIEEKKEDEVVVSVKKKTNVSKDIQNGRYSDRVDFEFLLTNKTEKAIKGVQGVLTINDLFDVQIISMECDFTGKDIPAKGTATYDSLCLEINEFMDDHVKLYNTKYEDLKFSYEITNVVYSNGESRESTSSEESSIQNRDVEVVVKSKKNIPEDIYNGIYSPRCEFTFSVKNNTDKAIKGVQGVLDCQDLFGKTIQRIGCDFTGQTIPAHGEATFSDLGVDINEFIDEDVKLYNEDYKDLKFEYEVKDIVYN